MNISANAEQRIADLEREIARAREDLVQQHGEFVEQRDLAERLEAYAVNLAAASREVIACYHLFRAEMSGDHLIRGDDLRDAIEALKTAVTANVIQEADRQPPVCPHCGPTCPFRQEPK